MRLEYKLPLLAVKDVGRSKTFYRELFDQDVILDLGRNVTFSGGFAVQEDFARLTEIPEDAVLNRSHNMELYFESDDFDAFLRKLDVYADIQYVHLPKKQDWQQRVVRIYDPDGHIIEVGENMALIARRYLQAGCSVTETARLIQYPVDFVKKIAMSEQETAGMLEVYEDVTMREVRLEDAALVWQAIYDHRDYLKTWLPFVLRLHTVEDEEAFLREVLAVPFEERNLVMVIEKKGVFCGLIGFVTTDRVNHRTEIGYWLLPEFQGQGIMTRCVRCLCEWAVRYRGMQRIQIRCAVGNIPSNAIPKRLGFRWEGIERAGELMISGEYADLNVYSILKNEIFP